MITAKTSSGFEIELDENIFRKDTELTEAMVFLDTDASGKCLFTAINHLLGPEGKKRLYEHLRTPEGTVALDDLAKAFGELVSCIKDGKNSQYYHILDGRALPLHLAATLAAGLPEASRSLLKLSSQTVPLETLLQAETVDTLHLLYWRLCVGKGAAPQLILDGLQGREGGSASDVQSFDSPEEFEAAMRAVEGG